MYLNKFMNLKLSLTQFFTKQAKSVNTRKFYFKLPDEVNLFTPNFKKESGLGKTDIVINIIYYK